MDTDLISKRDLLELTGISYGQLYRWKRKNLIPEEWFIRKSAFTGQETFFPREKMMERIDRIKNMKDDLSLDDLATMFSPSPAEIRLTPQAVLEQGIVSKTALDIFLQEEGQVENLTFDMILSLFMLHKALESGNATLDEARLLIKTLQEHAPHIQGKEYTLFLFRKLGVASCCLAPAPTEVYFESGTKVISRLVASSCIAELKLKLS